ALSSSDRTWLAGVLERLKLSARAYHRVLRVALTLADLAGLPRPERDQLIEAIGYRQLDRLLKR
ncbi:MAG TPA: ATP-dependent protease, partial [Halomonas sp.]|nr:ATP-dependent protease [Halomonas sp.]